MLKDTRVLVTTGELSVRHQGLSKGHQAVHLCCFVEEFTRANLVPWKPILWVLLQLSKDGLKDLSTI